VGFEPMIPVSKRAKTVHALDRSATVTGPCNIICSNFPVHSKFPSWHQVRWQKRLILLNCIWIILNMNFVWDTDWNILWIYKSLQVNISIKPWNSPKRISPHSFHCHPKRSSFNIFWTRCSYFSTVKQSTIYPYTIIIRYEALTSVR
jgi:hypothetical protein